MSSFSLIVLALCCAWASGINVYAVLLMLGLSSAFNHLPLPADLDVLTHPLVLFCLGFMYCVEFVADKIPVSIACGICCIRLSAYPWPFI